jgi:hypothetical protein
MHLFFSSGGMDLAVCERVKAQTQGPDMVVDLWGGGTGLN